MSKSSLKLDWCTHEAMTFALKRWYYRDVVPVGKLVRVGVWEDGEFAGVVVFGCGSSDALGKRFGLTPFQVCEMNRIALKPDHKCAVSRVINLAVNKFLRVQCPGIRLVITFSDPEAGHHGGVYQGAGWLYVGKSAENRRYLIDGTWHHSRDVRACGTRSVPGKSRVPCPKPSDATRVEKIPGKHRYMLPLDDEIRELVKREAKPAPRPDQRPSSEAVTSTS